MAITAVDSNVLFDILLPDPKFRTSSLQLLHHAHSEGRIIICEVVRAEVSAHFDDKNEFVRFLAETAILSVPSSDAACHLAGSLWKKHRKKGGARDRILPDFLVASHALFHADRLLTRDLGFYKRGIPELTFLTQ